MWVKFLCCIPGFREPLPFSSQRTKLTDCLVFPRNRPDLAVLVAAHLHGHLWRGPVIGAVSASEQCGGLGVVGDLLRIRIKVQHCARARGDVGEAAQPPRWSLHSMRRRSPPEIPPLKRLSGHPLARRKLKQRQRQWSTDRIHDSVFWFVELTRGCSTVVCRRFLFRIFHHFFHHLSKLPFNFFKKSPMYIYFFYFFHLKKTKHFFFQFFSNFFQFFPQSFIQCSSNIFFKGLKKILLFKNNKNKT